MFDLEKLYKQYLLYRVKKIFLPLVLFGGIVVALYFAYEEFFLHEKEQNKERIVVHKQLPKKRVVHHLKEPQNQKQEHYKFFTLSVRENKRSAIENVQKKYARLGLECRIEDQNNYLNLVCGETSSQKEYQKIKTILDKHHIKYYLVTKKEIPVTDKIKETSQKSTKTKKKKKITTLQKVEPLLQQETFSNLSHSDVDLKQLEEKFSAHKNYGVAIRIAQEYYKEKNYKASLKWAKQANNLDRKKRQSWILYAKSLYALGEKEKAIKVLKLYKHFSSSREVDRILQAWSKDDK